MSTYDVGDLICAYERFAEERDQIGLDDRNGLMFRRRFAFSTKMARNQSLKLGVVLGMQRSSFSTQDSRSNAPISRQR
jgi:hypothetical protein